MLGKAVAIILGLGAGAVLMLHARQERLVVLHDLAVLQARLAQHDRDFLMLRTRIAAGVSPGRVQDLAAALGPTMPLAAAPAGPADWAAGAARTVLATLPEARVPQTPASRPHERRAGRGSRE